MAALNAPILRPSVSQVSGMSQEVAGLPSSARKPQLNAVGVVKEQPQVMLVENPVCAATITVPRRYPSAYHIRVRRLPEVK
jgi:hypothetical protein